MFSNRLLKVFLLGTIVHSALLFGFSYPADRFIISFDQVPDNLDEWVVEDGYLTTGLAEVDQLNQLFKVNGYAKIFASSSYPLGRHLIFFRSSEENVMDEIINAYQALKIVKSIIPDYEGGPAAVPNDPYQNWNYLRDYGCDINRGWDLNTSGGDILVGIIDGGVQLSNPQISSSLYLNSGEDVDGDELITGTDSNAVDDDGNGFIDDFFGWDFVNNDNGIQASPHGTSVTSLIAATTNDSIGVVGIAGGWHSSTPPVRWIPTQVQNYSHIFSSIEYLAIRGVRVINISWIIGFLPIDTHEPWVDLMTNVVEPNEIVIVGGAGNDSTNNCQAPARSSYVISVGATGEVNRSYIRADFSNYGDLVDIAAPGIDWHTASQYGGPSVLFSGTSASAPVVSAAAVLILGMDSTKTRDEVRSLLLDWATPLADSDSLGAGQLNLRRSLAATKPPEAPDLVLQGYSQSNPVLSISEAAPDVISTVIQRKIVTNDRYQNIVEDWTAIDTTASTSSYIDVGFGYHENGPYIAAYRTFFLDIAGLHSPFSNSVATTGYIGIGKEVRQNSQLAVPFQSTYPAISIEDSLIYISDWGHGMFVFQVTPGGLENRFVFNSDWQAPTDQIAVTGDYLYAHYGPDSLWAWSLENPLSPRPISCTNDFFPATYQPMSMVARDQYLFIAGLNPLPLREDMPIFQIVDFSDPSQPVSMFIQTGTTSLSGIQFAPGNDRYVVTSGYHQGYVWDTEWIEAPIQTDFISSGFGTNIRAWDEQWIVSRKSAGLGFWEIDSLGQIIEAPPEYNLATGNTSFQTMDARGEYIAAGDGGSVFLYKKGADNLPALTHRWDLAGVTGLALGPSFLAVTTSDSLYLYDLELWVDIHPEPEGLTSDYHLGTPYPNPFNPITTIQYHVPNAARVSLKIYDLRGREIITLLDGYREPGRYNIVFDAADLSSGLYFCRMNAPGFFSQVVKLSVVK